jgi:hypothetical protein
MKRKKENIKEKRKISSLRERFLVKYCKEKGWNYKELTTGQMLHIVTKPEYKNPQI